MRSSGISVAPGKQRHFQTPTGVAVESTGQIHPSTGHTHAATSWRVGSRNTARTGLGRLRSPADRSTWCWDGWESDQSYPPAVEPKSCDPYRRIAVQSLSGSDAPGRLRAHAIRWRLPRPNPGNDTPTRTDGRSL